jgi:hypothetical protein
MQQLRERAAWSNILVPASKLGWHFWPLSHCSVQPRLHKSLHWEVIPRQRTVWSYVVRRARWCLVSGKPCCSFHHQTSTPLASLNLCSQSRHRTSLLRIADQPLAKRWSDGCHWAIVFDPTITIGR